MKSLHFLAGLTLVLGLSCSSKKEDKVPTPATGAAPPSSAPQAEPTGLPPGTITVLRSKRENFATRSAAGESHNWKLLKGIEVEGESVKELYQSRGSFFVAFKAQIKAVEQDCLLRWRTDFLATPTGEGELVAKVEGARALVAGESTIVSGVVALASKDASRVQSASAGFWTLCGPDLPSQSAHDITIANAVTEDVDVGNAITIHFSVVDLERPAKKAQNETRCHFNIVAEDVDSEGYTLNRDFASYSLGPKSSGQAKLRRTAFEGGSAMDYAKAVASKRYYLNDLSCQEKWDAKTSKASGISISDIALHRYVSSAAETKDLDRARYDYSASLKNESGQDCAFRVRFRMLDREGFDLHKAPVLSEVFHLRKDSSTSYRSDNRRLYTWLDQAESAGSLVVHEARPIRECASFDPKKALPASAALPE